MCQCCTFLFWLHKTRKHSCLSQFFNFYSLGFSQPLVGVSYCKFFFCKVGAHGSEKIMRKCLIVQISRRRTSGVSIHSSFLASPFVRYTGECFMYIIIETGLFSPLAKSKRGLSRYKTKIIFYSSNQLIFKCRCMRNASLGSSCCVSDAWPVLDEGA